jgi:flagellar basal-body rod modification protein FlgD
MVTPIIAAAAPRESTGTAASNPISGTDNLFLQLLTAQLKTQSPLDPVDPNQFVGQLVQLNTLDQIAQIRQLLASKLT